MKCKSCGSPLEIEDAYCSFCGRENPKFAKHRRDMAEYAEDYLDTKEEVYASAKGHGIKVAQISVLSVLIVCCIITLFLIGNAYRIGNYLMQLEVSHNYEIHAQKMEEFIGEEDYIGLNAYYYDHYLYHEEKLSSYQRVATLANNYTDIYLYALTLYRIKEQGLTLDSEELEGNLTVMGYAFDSFYNYREPKEYDDPACYTEEHLATISRMEDQLNLLCKTYLNLTEEDLVDFPTMTNAHRQVLIAERMELDV